jgi:hypothetical protein
MAKKKSVGLILVSDAGNPVFVHKDGTVFSEWTGKDFQRVDEAVVQKGTYEGTLQGIAAKYVADSSLPTDFLWSLNLTGGRYGMLRSSLDREYGFGGSYSWSARRTSDKYWYQQADGTKVDIDGNQYTTIGKAWDSVVKRFRDSIVPHESKFFFHNTLLEFAVVLSLLGEGTRVSPVSLKEAHGMDESNPKFWIGDRVEWKGQGGLLSGSIVSLRVGSAYILSDEGKKRTAAFSKLTKTNKSAAVEDVTDVPDEMLKVFEEAIEKMTLYKSNMSYLKIDEPFMSGENVRECWTACCPNCNSPLAETNYYRREGGDYRCVACGQYAKLVSKTEVKGTAVGVFALAMKPQKNRFALREARCCANCGLFHFEYGRQGKRSTGYCKRTNQCVQGFNTCDVWFPRDGSSYSKSISQHVTNLGYGVKDFRNLNRGEQNIEDNVYTEEDHEVQRERAEKVKVQYQRLLLWFENQLVEKAKGYKAREWM